jgi:NADH-quinone oxidoreductase subunit L
MRQITLTFLGKPRTDVAEHAHETPWTMTVPLIILSLFAISVGWTGIPEKFPIIGNRFPNWFHDYVGGSLLEHPEAVAFSFVPLLTSLVVSIGGITLGWLLYRRIKAGDKDPLESSLGSLYTLLKNKYYFDELYDRVFVQPAYAISRNFTYLFLDRKIIDGILHWVAYVSPIIGSFLRNYIDKPIVNGSGDLVGEGTKRLGRTFRFIQSGKVQQYMIVALVSLAAFSVLFYYLLTSAP